MYVYIGEKKQEKNGTKESKRRLTEGVTEILVESDWKCYRSD